MWPRAFLDDPGGAEDENDMNYGAGNGSKRKGQAGIQVKFFELSRDGAKLRMEWRKRMNGEVPPKSKDPNAPIVVLEEPGSLMNRAVDAYAEALRLYMNEIDEEARNPSFVCGAQQNLGVALMESNRCLESQKHLLDAERTSIASGLEHGQNHCALCENLCSVFARLKDWKGEYFKRRRACIAYMEKHCS